MAQEASRPASRVDLVRALREAAITALIAFGMFLPLIGFNTVQNIHNELVLETRWPLLAAIAILGLGLAASESRGGLVAAAMALVAACIFFKERRAQVLVLLGVAGTDTTRNSITHGVMAFAEHPEQWDLVTSDPERHLPTAVEEVLRWTSPVSMFARTATRDVEVGGAAIGAGERVTLWYPSANRDEAAFSDPFRFDVTRSPNHHVAFGGGGVHYCLGASLARSELRAMFGQMVTRWRDVELIGPPRWNPVGRGRAIATWIDALPARFTATEPQPA